MRRSTARLPAFAGGIRLIAAVGVWSALACGGPIEPTVERDELVSATLVGVSTAGEASVWIRTEGAAVVSMRYAADSSLEGATESDTVSTNAAADFTATVRLTGLQPDTDYFYEPIVDGVPARSGPISRFHTPPIAGTSIEFKFAVLTDFTLPSHSSGESYGSVDAEGPAFVFLGGDMDHRNPPGLPEMRQMHRDNRDATLGSRAALVDHILRKYWVAHQWDDHDYGVNNGDKTFPGRAAALQAFREYWPMPVVSPDGIWYSFSYGQVDFFVLDTRSQRDNNRDPDDQAKSMLDGDNLGAVGQLEWLLQGLADSNATWRIIFSTVPWNPTIKCAARDSWCGYQTERQRILDFVQANGIERVVVLSGDIHSGAIDNGFFGGFWEMVTPHADTNLFKCDTSTPAQDVPGSGFGEWAVGTYGRGFLPPKYCPGYGLVEVRTDPDRLVLSVKDEFGTTKITATVPFAPPTPATIDLTRTSTRLARSRTPFG